MARTLRSNKRKLDDDNNVTTGATIPPTENGFASSSPPPAKKRKDTRRSTRSRPTTPTRDMKNQEEPTAAHQPPADANATPQEKNNTATVDIWIGASTNLVGLYYGTVNDKRNWTAVPQLDKGNSSVEDAYYWAALQAIERCENESSRVVIYTDCDALCDMPDNAESNDLCKELHSKIHQSDGLIHIQHAASDTSSELRKAHELVKAPMDIEQDNKEPAKEQDQDVENQVRKLDVHAAVAEKEDEPMKSEHQDDQVTGTATKSTPSWRPAFNLANIIEILRAPFVRNNNNQQQ
ncbi:hypothetical protein K492DRAFT_177120 [Lichtheimia hyalospora FSU 10163]|nr:hypothetical protein K492DRAFT_177120 [Lichtheimia hyalospora FSU 10163]